MHLQASGEAFSLPMFPLSTVLLPYEQLPLHVFEERYRHLVADCTAADGRFGVVLIARGAEVGGGDERVAVGTIASIDVVSETPDGRYGIVARGVGRLAIRTWLPDAPYPLALVEQRADVREHITADQVERVADAVRAVRALWSELGEGPALLPSAPLAPSLAEEVWRLCSETPLGPLDRQRLLEADGPATRLELLAGLLADLRSDFETLLSNPGT